METIKVGDGLIIVTSTINQLVFREMDTNKNTYVGQSVELQDEYLGKVKCQHILSINNYNELQDFKKLLTNAYEQKVFTFKHIQFDMTNFNRKSVDCIIDQVNWMEKFYPRLVVV